MTTFVVGIDGSESSREALQWAHREATSRPGTDVTAVLAWSYLDQHHIDPDAEFDLDYDEAKAAAALDHHVRQALGDAAADVSQRVVDDRPVPGLLSASEGADLLVLGARGLGGFTGMLLGSVSQQCLHHATVPVAIVRPDGEGPRETGRVVVGTDGSERSRPAVRWALEEGRRRGSTVTVLHSWHLPFTAASPWVVTALDADEFEEGARLNLDGLLATEDTSGVEVERRTVHGTAAAALIEAAADADLVVVGSRGIGGFRGLVLGSVSQQVARHAPCPVVVVPSDEG
jgi:nucleotide-binding universal stress UspA family protein